MIYKYTEDNIRAILQSVGTLEEAQLVTFFSNELQPIRVKYLLNQLALDHDITCDEEHKTFSALGAPEVIGEIADRRTLAFWAIANMGSNSVNEIILTRYPTQFLVIGPNANACDFTVVETVAEARVAARMFAETLQRDTVDDVNHIAVLRRASDLDMLQETLTKVGFDSCCVIDPNTKKPEYIQL